jgi:hypothetical protein
MPFAYDQKAPAYVTQMEIVAVIDGSYLNHTVQVNPLHVDKRAGKKVKLLANPCARSLVAVTRSWRDADENNGNNTQCGIVSSLSPHFSLL